jgi:hypothetical protein
MRTLLVNAIITPDGTRLQSTHRHDYRSHVDANGETYSIDGGLDYVRCSVNAIPAVNDCVYSDDSHELIREAFTWGTYGKNGDEKLTRKKLADLTDEHIAAIIETQYQISKEVKKIFYDEITYRKTIRNEKNN